MAFLMTYAPEPILSCSLLCVHLTRLTKYGFLPHRVPFIRNSLGLPGIVCIFSGHIFILFIYLLIFGVLGDFSNSCLIETAGRTTVKKSIIQNCDGFSDLMADLFLLLISYA